MSAPLPEGFELFLQELRRRQFVSARIFFFRMTQIAHVPINISEIFMAVIIFRMFSRDCFRQIEGRAVIVPVPCPTNLYPRTGHAARQFR